MGKNLYITATEARSGKSAIALGVMEMLIRNIDRVGFFRPIISGRSTSDICELYKDNDIDLISTHFHLELEYDEMYAYTEEEALHLISIGKQAELIDGILAKYNQMAERFDFVLCEGYEFSGSSASFDFDLNAEISNNMGCPVLLVANAHKKDSTKTFRSIKMYMESFDEMGCDVIATIVNRMSQDNSKEIIKQLETNILKEDHLTYAIPDDPSLGNPTIDEIATLMCADVIYGEDQLDHHASSYIVAAMHLQNFLEWYEHGTLVITPGDRADVIVSCLSAATSSTMPHISGILLTGGIKPEPQVLKLLEGFYKRIPILSVKEDTFQAARILDNLHAVISPNDKRKIFTALGAFERNVDVARLSDKIISSQSTIVTPKMFEYGLIQTAKTNKQKIVLPEGEDERILKASEILLKRDVVDLILLGDENVIKEKISHMGLILDKAEIIDPSTSKYYDDYVKEYFDLRKKKGISLEMAHDSIRDVSFFGTMMVRKGHADGMVSGAVHTTSATIRPAFEVIKTKPGCSVVSSVFFMCLADKVLVYGDCAVNPNPKANQLAEIAISSALTAKTFGVEPIVAMLSYSTGESGSGEDVDIVKAATKIAKDKLPEVFPDLLLEGPIQYDAAVDKKVAATKMPDSQVAGKATVFIFPDLNTGNNTYKAVQRSAGAVAIGPVLQGLNKPVNDLSRGCLIPDVVNTVAITAIQAQAEKGLL